MELSFVCTTERLIQAIFSLPHNLVATKGSMSQVRPVVVIIGSGAAIRLLQSKLWKTIRINVTLHEF